MNHLMPQEMEVWYVLPAVRRELALILTRKHKLSQRETAHLLGMTEAAVSQYLNKKRGAEVKFTAAERKTIAAGANNILKEPKHLTKHIYNLLRALRGSKPVCDLHRKFDGTLEHNCDICMHQ